MRILLSSHGAGPYGAERMLLALARGLSSRGHEIIIDFPHDGPAVEHAREMAGVEVRVDARARLPRNARELVAYVLRIPATVGRIRKVVRDESPDVTWVNSLFNPWALVAATLAGSPAVWHLHERNPSGPSGALPSMLIRLTRASGVAVSQYVARSYSRFPGDGPRLRTLSNPLLDPVEPAPLRAGEPFTVGCVGQLEPRKRAPDLARALALLPDVHGVFVGEGKAKHQLERAVHQAGVVDRVRLVGLLADIYAEMRLCDCIAIPAVREPFGLVALEAMAAGVPVIAARSGALPDVLGDAALYHAPRDSRDLARQIERLRSDVGLRTALRERGLGRVRDFGFDEWLDAAESIARTAARTRPANDRKEARP